MPGKKDDNKLISNDHLNEEDRVVWKKVSDTAEPLKSRSELTGLSKSAAKSREFKKPPQAPNKKSLPQHPTTQTYIPSQQTSPSAAPSLGVDKALKRKLGRGQMEIEARLDLHGKTKDAAHHILKSFLINAQSRQLRTVLVITGKGEQGIARHTLHSFDVIHTPERSGVLMRSVPQWLNQPDFRKLVVGYQPAHPKHGGGGALYVRVRRIR